MAQIANLLAVATVFSGLWTLIFIFYSQGGGLICETKLLIQELELKYARRGVFAGFYGIRKSTHTHFYVCANA